MTIDKQVKRKWLKALRSGEYRQGRGCLRSKGKTFDTFCCLGVLLDITDPKAWDRTLQSLYLWGTERAECALPESVRDEIGLDDEEEGTLITLNDDGGNGFKRIANWIEKNL
jgi:hypothetical protein